MARLGVCPGPAPSQAQPEAGAWPGPSPPSASSRPSLVRAAVMEITVLEPGEPGRSIAAHCTLLFYYYCSTSSILYYHQGRFCLNSGPSVFVYFKISGWENQQEIMLEIAKFFRSLFMIGHILSLADTKTKNLNTSDQVTTAPVRRCRMRGWCGCRRRAARGRPRYRPRRRAAR